MAKGDDLEERLIDFAVRIIDLTNKLPKSRTEIHISGQVLRSGTSPAALNGEARSAESASDFIHKRKICLKELNESKIWLKIIKRSGLASEEQVIPIQQECEELCRIINASIQTSKKRLMTSKNDN